MTEAAYELAINTLEEDVAYKDGVIVQLYKRLAYSEQRRRAHFTELQGLKYEKKVTSRRLGDKRRRIRDVVKYLL